MSEVILHISAGKGPRECHWVVAQLACAFAKEARGMGLECEALDGLEDLPSSILLRIEGEAASAFAAKRIGSNQWIGISPFRPFHKRRNWFVGVAIAPEPDAIIDLKNEDIDYQAMRASGPGGQHVNKTDSAIRATHRPTGLVATAQEQRSQHANRRVARTKLAIMLEERRGQANDGAKRLQWQAHQDLERGNAVRVYLGKRFVLKE
ncbi:MAG: peptide chain release factor H [Novosphingobium sp.]